MIMRSEKTRRIPAATNEHTFAVCAYGKCKYLEGCIVSLLNQTVSSKIIIVTSTPNAEIQAISEKYVIPVYINKGETGITQDWNYALSKVKTKYATIAHQDDEYGPKYTEQLLRGMNSHNQPLIAFSDYIELRGENRVSNSELIKIKRRLLFPLRIRWFQSSRFIRRRVLSLGCAICCPSVMYCLDVIKLPLFSNKYICCEDWEAWEKLSQLKGSFVYVPQPLMSHRIHEESVTTKTVKSTGRKQEDYEMYRKFWPTWIAKILINRYSKAEEYNKA